MMVDVLPIFIVLIALFSKTIVKNKTKIIMIQSKTSPSITHKKTLVWIAIAFASALSFFFSWHFFANAFPLLNVDISMSRDAALSTAKVRATSLKLAPAQAHTAIRFSTDSDTQNFIELEGGGKQTFLNMLHQDVYQALQWQVRFFRENTTETTTLYFTPQGKPYGFERHLADDAPGAALDAEQARSIAEAAALRDWNVDLSPEKSPYDLVEKSFEKRTSGRIDHLFVYERRDQRLGKNGEGRVRIALTVAGDQLVGLQHVIKIPEAFMRRFTEMRSANTTIALGSQLAMGLFYILGGCVLGLFLLKREHRVIARPALKWAALIALLQSAVMLNNIPSAWFSYDTAISANSFLGQQIMMAFGIFIVEWLLLSISFMAAEGLSRKAFGHQPQLWKLWSAGAGNSWGVLGRTAGGYLWVGFDLAFIVIFYYLTQHYLGWWSPLESIIDPNILATPMPWLAPVAQALHAGVWEECLFRAVPLAGAALIGDYVGRRFNGRFGARNTWLVIGLIVQALIFGAAHASYAQQPSYARLVELFLPSIAWGIIYLRFGLLPGIIFHFIFDLLLMSLPLFALDAPGLAMSRTIVIACGAVPLLMLLIVRWRAGKWEALSLQRLNSAWQPNAVSNLVDSAPIKHSHDRSMWKRTRAALPITGAIGLVLWIAFASFTPDELPLYLNRAQAEQAADAALAKRGITLSAEWQRFAVVEQTRDESETFIWREGGAKMYHALTGSYLTPPVWKVRYLRLTGDVAQRAEEWIVKVENGVDGHGGREALPHVRIIDHEIPAAAAGASLNVSAARLLVRDAIRQRFNRDPDQLREISANEIARPNRKDWRFMFADDKASVPAGGEALVNVYVVGDEVSYLGRQLRVPEAWSRHERERQSPLEIAKGIVGVLSALLMIAVAVIAIIQAANTGVNMRRFIGVSLFAFVLGVAAKANAWQELAMRINTAQPLAAQLWGGAAIIAFGTLLMSLAFGLFAGLAAHRPQHGKLGETRFINLLWPSLLLAMTWVGLSALMSKAEPPNITYWQGAGALNQAYPFFGSMADGVLAALQKLGIITFILMALREFSASFTRRRAVTLLLLLPLGLIGGMSATSMPSFLLLSIANALIIISMYLLVARFEPKMMLFAMMPSIFAPIVLAVQAPYPDAAWYTVFYLLGVGLTAAWWMQMLEVQPQNKLQESEATVLA